MTIGSKNELLRVKAAIMELQPLRIAKLPENFCQQVSEGSAQILDVTFTTCGRGGETQTLRYVSARAEYQQCRPEWLEPPFDVDGPDDDGVYSCSDPSNPGVVYKCVQ